jgi:hypothetical protein
MATTVIDGYTITATFNATYGSIGYTITNPDGTLLFTAGSSNGVSSGLNNLINRANNAGNTDFESE